MSRTFLIIALLYSFPAYSSEISFERLVAITETPAHLKGNFTQEKYLKILETGLVSKGVFSYKKGEYLNWETLDPIYNKLSLTPTNISNEQDAVSSVLSEILFSVLTAQWGSLSKYFDLSGRIEDQTWAVVLLPVDVAIAGIITKVELVGDVLLRKIVLHEKDGDYTTIELAYQYQ